MKWRDLSANWADFYEAITDKWPDAEEDRLDEIDGEKAEFITYVAEITDMDPTEAREEIDEWLENEIPSDMEIGGDFNDFNDEEDE